MNMKLQMMYVACKRELEEKEIFSEVNGNDNKCAWCCGLHSLREG